jgi:hypothetical protein
MVMMNRARGYCGDVFKDENRNDFTQEQGRMFPSLRLSPGGQELRKARQFSSNESKTA